MKEQNNRAPLHTEEVGNSGPIEEKMRRTYLAPKMEVITVELENNIAAGSITIKETEDIVEEGWMVEDDVVREIDIDLF